MLPSSLSQPTRDPCPAAAERLFQNRPPLKTYTRAGPKDTANTRSDGRHLTTCHGTYLDDGVTTRTWDTHSHSTTTKDAVMIARTAFAITASRWLSRRTRGQNTGYAKRKYLAAVMFQLTATNK